MQEKLRQSEAYLAEAQQLSHTGSFGWRVSTGRILWSDETFRIFQYDPMTKPNMELVLQRVHPEDAALVKQTTGRAAREGTDFDYEHRLLMPDGSVKHLRVVGHPSAEKDSGKLEFVGAVTDITERKRSELLLRESEQRFRAIFDEAGTGIALWIGAGLAIAGGLLAVLLYALGGARPQRADIALFLTGEAPAWHSPPLLAAVRGRSSVTISTADEPART